MAVIFDLDQTLVDSSIALPFRNARNWTKVYSLIPRFVKYPGVDDILVDLERLKIPACIVTNTPRPYCTRVVNHFQWSFKAMICYHDTNQHKPHPEPILKAVDAIHTEPSNVVSIGDQARDIIASKRAGVISVAATWGSNELGALLDAEADYVCNTTQELKQTLLTHFKNICGL